MNVGLVGFPSVGKSTLFRAVSAGHDSGDLAAVSVPDERFTRLCRVADSKKQSPAHVYFHDNVGRFSPGESRSTERHFFDAARKMDCLVHVVRSFRNDQVTHHAELDPLRDHRLLEDELVLEDLQLVENRLERLQKQHETHISGSPESNEQRLLQRLKGELEQGKTLRSLELEAEERKLISGFQFLTVKPLIVALNVGEDRAAARPEDCEESLASDAAQRGVPVVSLCATLEAEIATLDEQDRQEFLSDLGLGRPASERLIRAAYEALHVITFYTTGPKETKAWTLPVGATALDAAATIHSDLARGFIRAEVAPVDVVVECGGWDAAHHAGKTTLQGKEYVVQDGDIIHVRFKV